MNRTSKPTTKKTVAKKSTRKEIIHLAPNEERLIGFCILVSFTGTFRSTFTTGAMASLDLNPGDKLNQSFLFKAGSGGCNLRVEHFEVKR
jgi:hypothetical protein